MLQTSLILTAIAVSCSCFVWLLRRRLLGPLPPGPKPFPVVGNILDLPGKEPWIAAGEWHRKYGDICYLHVMGQGMIFLNSSEAAFELLDRRGVMYSDKQRMVMAVELCGCDVLGFLGYGDKLRQTRRMMQRALGPTKISAYQQMIEVEVHGLLQRLLADPANYDRHLPRFAGALTVSVAYGHRVASNDDRFLALAKHMMDVISQKIVPAPPRHLWVVDIFPFLKNVPPWFPFSGFKRKAAIWKAEIMAALEEPYHDLKRRMSEGDAVPCFCSNILEEEGDLTPEREKMIMWAANSIFAASVDTTTTVLTHFILAMMLYPEKFVRAREEIDKVAHDRLPQFSDRPRLPYVECVMSEVLRWAAPVPLNLPHMVMEDDEYEGYHIPKGSLIIANLIAMLRNEQLYPDPEAFIPERFENLHETAARAMDPRQFVFGFGRRRCPGVHLVESTIWLVLVSMIATLDISKPVDRHGHAVEPEVRFENTVFRIPSKFDFVLKARTNQHARLIHDRADKEVQ